MFVPWTDERACKDHCVNGSSEPISHPFFLASLFLLSFPPPLFYLVLNCFVHVPCLEFQKNNDEGTMSATQ